MLVHVSIIIRTKEKTNWLKIPNRKNEFRSTPSTRNMNHNIFGLRYFYLYFFFFSVLLLMFEAISDFSPRISHEIPFELISFALCLCACVFFLSIGVFEVHDCGVSDDKFQYGVYVYFVAIYAVAKWNPNCRWISKQSICDSSHNIVNKLIDMECSGRCHYPIWRFTTKAILLTNGWENSMCICFIVK